MKDAHIEITHLYDDAAGSSHFGSVQITTTLLDFAPPAPPVNASIPQETKCQLFVVLPPKWYGEPHPAPARQLMTLVQGKLEVITSDGAKKIFQPGDVALVEDTEGVGHATRNLDDSETILAITQYQAVPKTKNSR